MSRLLPYPLLSLSLLALWLLLNQSLGPGHLLLGTVLAVGGGLALTALEPPRTRIRRPHLIIALAVVVLRDIIRSNIAVAQIIIKPNRGGITSGFVGIPLDMRSPPGLTLLAIIITPTPGPLWLAFDPLGPPPVCSPLTKQTHAT